MLPTVIAAVLVLDVMLQWAERRSRIRDAIRRQRVTTGLFLSRRKP